MTALSYIYRMAKVFNRKTNRVEDVPFMHVRDPSKYPWMDLPRIRSQKGVGRPKAKRDIMDDCMPWIRQCGHVNGMFDKWKAAKVARDAAVAQR